MSSESDSKLAASGRDCGLTDIAASQDQLKYDYTHFIPAVTNATQKIEICGASLNFLYASDNTLHVLSQRAAQGLHIEILLPADENPVVMAIFQDRFEDHIRRTAKSLAAQITQQAPNITLKRIATKALTITMVRIDDEMLVKPYLSRGRPAKALGFCSAGLRRRFSRCTKRNFERSPTADLGGATVGLAGMGFRIGSGELKEAKAGTIAGDGIGRGPGASLNAASVVLIPVGAGSVLTPGAEGETPTQCRASPPVGVSTPTRPVVIRWAWPLRLGRGTFRKDGTPPRGKSVR